MVIEMLNLLKTMYSYEDLEDTLDLKRIALYTRNDEKDLQERVCKDFLEEISCTYDNIKVYKDIRKGVDMNTDTINHLISDIRERKIDTILCLQLETLTRNKCDLVYLLQVCKENKVRLLTIH